MTEKEREEEALSNVSQEKITRGFSVLMHSCRCLPRPKGETKTKILITMKSKQLVHQTMMIGIAISITMRSGSTKNGDHGMQKSCMICRASMVMTRFNHSHDRILHGSQWEFSVDIVWTTTVCGFEEELNSVERDVKRRSESAMEPFVWCADRVQCIDSV